MGELEQATPASCSPSLPYHCVNFKHGHPLPPQSDTNATDGRGQWNAVFISLPKPEKQMPRVPYLPPPPPTLHPVCLRLRPSLICIISKANGYKLFPLHLSLVDSCQRKISAVIEVISLPTPASPAALLLLLSFFAFRFAV